VRGYFYATGHKMGGIYLFIFNQTRKEPIQCTISFYICRALVVYDRTSFLVATNFSKINHSMREVAICQEHSTYINYQCRLHRRPVVINKKAFNWLRYILGIYLCL
jgi:hypothetical protein